MCLAQDGERWKIVAIGKEREGRKCGTTEVTGAENTKVKNQAAFIQRLGKRFVMQSSFAF